ncbi:trypsin-like serine protease [Aquabacterium humicola]|uniref:trypsin-like serine protease n=1 Tax=Aquabacterium humicola TaxID=3237377 RepID=UPI0025437488|nr:trypsin-like serine protease [Rubrivivax pictus]
MFQRLTLTAVTAAALLTTVPAQAITDGELDGNRHPNVGLMVALDSLGNPMWRCSGTLVSPRHYLTAGHCTDGAARVTIWFDADIDAGRPGNGYPTSGQVFGTPYTHPLFPTASFVVNDVGVVVLENDFGAPPYATLPAIGALDQLARRRGKQDVSFTAVGYGLQKSFPDAASWQTQANRVRMLATPKLLQINVPGFTGDFSVLLSNNANTGGTCFGDSGGPNFIGSSNVIGGVTSFGINGNCAGTGGVFRMDTSNVQDWLKTFPGLMP